MMKSLFYFLSVSIFVLFYGCKNEVDETITYKINVGVTMPAVEFRNSVDVTDEPEAISKNGKICFYNGYLFISETDAGIHIIDNRKPAEPKPIGFIKLLGNTDLAVRNNLLYADSYIDLVWFDISNPSSPVLKGRFESIFPYAFPPADNQYGYDYTTPGGDEVIVGWKVEERTETIPRHNGDLWMDNSANANYGGSGGSESSGGNGISGSMSRFSLYNSYMYTVINNYMSIFDLSGTEPVKTADRIYIGGNVETIFSYKNNLFMGTPGGMMIYSVADPLNPEYQSFVTHIYGCDPVVVEDDIAYVTVRTGNFCGQNANELIIFDVSNVKSPKHLVSYGMKNPKGLGIDKGTLFLCDDGLKVYDAKSPQTIMANQLAHYSGMDGFDVIPYNHVLMMIADDGLYQYDYTDPKAISQLSKLPISKQ